MGKNTWTGSSHFKHIMYGMTAEKIINNNLFVDL